MASMQAGQIGTGVGVAILVIGGLMTWAGIVAIKNRSSWVAGLVIWLFIISAFISVASGGGALLKANPSTGMPDPTDPVRPSTGP